MFLRIIVFLQISLMSLMANPSVDPNSGIGKISTQLKGAGALVTPNDTNGGVAFNLVKYVIIFLGMMIMGMGINDTFVAEDHVYCYTFYLCYV